jgi:WD40 repeat protein
LNFAKPSFSAKPHDRPGAVLRPLEAENPLAAIMITQLHALAGDPTYSSNVDISPDGNILATAGHSSGAVKLWNLRTGKETAQVRTLGGLIHSVRFFADGKRLLAGTQSGCWLLDVRKGAVTSFPKAGDARGAIPLADQQRFVTYGLDGRLRLWDVSAQEPLFESPKYKGGWGPLAVGDRHCAVGSGQAISVWDIDGRQEVHFLRGHTAPVRGLAFFPDGTTLASGGADRKIRFWNLADGRLTGEIETEKKQQVWSLAYLGDGNLLACGTGNFGAGSGKLSLWDVERLQLIAETEVLNDAPLWIACSPRAPLIAGAAGHGGTVRVWFAEVAPGQFVPHELPGQPRRPAAANKSVVAGDRPLDALLLQLCSNNARLRREAAHEILTRQPLGQDSLRALAAVQPLPDEVADFFGKKLASKSYAEASTVLAGLLGLPPRKRDAWIPTLLDHLRRFANNSEWSWIIECLPAHYRNHWERINRALRGGLESSHALGPYSAFEVLHQLGTRASALVPDVLAYIGRQKAFTNEEPHLIHLDPTGKEAIPGLIRLLRTKSQTVRSQAAGELAAYGPRARPAVPVLTELTERANAGRRLDTRSVKSALGAIQASR